MAEAIFAPRACTYESLVVDVGFDRHGLFARQAPLLGAVLATLLMLRMAAGTVLMHLDANFRMWFVSLLLLLFGLLLRPLAEIASVRRFGTENWSCWWPANDNSTVVQLVACCLCANSNEIAQFLRAQVGLPMLVAWWPTLSAPFPPSLCEEENVPRASVVYNATAMVGPLIRDNASDPRAAGQCSRPTKCRLGLIGSWLLLLRCP